MKKVVTTITAAIFALGLVSAGLAQTTQTPVKPEVKKEAPAATTPMAPKEAAKPAVAKPEVAKPGEVKSEAVKPGEHPAAKDVVKSGDTKKETKKDKKEAKKEKTEKKAGAPVEKSQPEKK